MKSEEKYSVSKTRFKAVRNIFIVYLFTAVVTDRYKIFAAICASFPLILPVIFCDENLSASNRMARSVLCGIPGILSSVLFMLLTESYSTWSWLIPSCYSLLSCVGFSLVQRKMTAHKRAVMKCVISVLVCFLAFV